MKAIFLGTLGAVIIIGTVMVLFFANGYDYELKPTAQRYPSVNGYTASPECVARQREKQQLQEPLKRQAEPLAAQLIHGDLPLENGQAIYDQYAAILAQISDLENKYAC